MIHYQVYGKFNRGDWIILIHGIGGSSTIWFKQLVDLKRKYKVLVLDLPSHGESPDIEGNKWSVEKCVEEIREAILKENIEEFHLMGVSLGSILIHEWLKIDYKKIKSAILVGSIIRFNWKAKVLINLAKIGKLILPIRWLYPLCAFALMPFDNHRDSRLAFIKESKKVKESEFLKWFIFFDLVEKVYNEDCRKPVRKLYISGDQDYMFINEVKDAANKDEYAEFIEIKNAGHVCNIEKGKEFNLIINKFLDKVRTRN